MKNIFSVLILAFLVTSCNSSSDQKDKKVKNPLESQVKAIKKAKDAEKKILDAAKKQREAIDKATQQKKQSDKG